MTATAHRGPSQWALGLGYAGLIPFVGLVLAVWFSDASDRVRSAAALLAYSATILSFLGAIHWGLAMRDASDPPVARLAWGVVPSLVAWLALLWGSNGGLLLLAASLWTCWAVDHAIYPRFGLEGWLAMRLTLTAVASLSCVGAVLGALQ